MNEGLRIALAPHMPISRLLTKSNFAIALAYLAGYVLLDWVSYVHPFALSGITPWNPQTGLSFALILLFGRNYISWLFVAPLLGAIAVRHLALPIGVELLVVAAIAIGYSTAGLVLLSPRVRFDPSLSNKRSLLILMMVALASIAAVAALHAGILVAFGILQPAEFLYAAGQAFIGDVIGVTIVTPFLLILFTRKDFSGFSFEFLLLAAFTCLSFWLVFGVMNEFRFQLFYLFFIPVIWTAVRFGLEGVTAGLVLTQIGLILSIQMSDQSSADVISYQALMVVLAVTGLSVGVLVNEQRRAQQQIRLQQEALNRVSRVGAMGEFAAAVAHEINQPLTAIANYTRLAKRAAEKQDAVTATEAAGNAIRQVDRAAEVVRRLRDFIRLGRSERGPASVEQLATESLSLCRPELEKHGVDIRMEIPRDLPQVIADNLQIQQVIVNLLRNSIEALALAGRFDGRIEIKAAQNGGMVDISVSDNGPGFDADIAGRPITPFTTTKDDGLGIGLSLARSIVEAHDGKLTIGNGPRGAVVSLTLPCADLREYAA